MAIGERIRFIRNLRGMTQKYLGTLVGFPEKTADIRMAQYESGKRTPKSNLTEELANILDVSTRALNVPDIDTELGLMHTLFALEDIYGFKINKIDGEICISLDKNRGMSYISLDENFTAWYNEAQKYHNGEITKDDYDKWRYNYPKFDIDSGFVKLPSQKLSDKMIESFKD